jgi:putative ATP-binding cassette transporter
MRISKAFGSVSDALSWFISNYASLTGWRATVNRLCEFQRVMHLQQGLQPAQGTAELAAAHNSIERQLTDSPFLRVHDLTLALPNGQPLLTLDSLRIDPAARCLIRGPSGAGKSTLMRALAGLWTFGTGKIEVPAAARMMFLPQQSYLPVGTFKAALTYPAPADTITDEACSEVLQAVSLAAYIEQIDNPESEHWARRLSPGEQQRLAFARALLQKPDFLFLDEATSAVDIPTEQGLYKTLISWLPNTAIISIAHRESLNEFHQCTFDVTRISAEVHSQKSL